MAENLFRKYTLPGLKRWFLVIFFGFSAIAFGVLLLVKAHPVTFFAKATWEFLSFIAENIPPTVSGILAIVVGVFFLAYSFIKANMQVFNMVAPDESSMFEALDRYHMEGRGIKIVAIGGGTGLSNMLRGLKSYTSNITAVVTVADDGGSSGRLRQAMDMVPPGDIRNCIAALAHDDETITRLFQYRFDGNASDDLQGHSFGNLFLTGLVELGGSKNMADAVKDACSILKTRGLVLPVSNEPMQLVAKMSNGEVIHGESKITEAHGVIDKLSCEKPVPVLPSVIDAIEEADLIVLGPGSLYTSIIPNLLVDELVEAISNADATKVYVCNVMTQPGETTDYSVADHLKTIFKHLPSGYSPSDIVNNVVVNDASPDKKQLQKYKEKNQEPVQVDFDQLKSLGIKVQSTNLLQKGDLVRHNFRKLSKAIMGTFIEDHESVAEGKKAVRESRKLAKSS